MKILDGMLPDYWGGYIPSWICTHGYEEVRNYRITLFIQSIVENNWWGGCNPHIPPPWIRLWYATKRLFASFATAVFRKFCRGSPWPKA